MRCGPLSIGPRVAADKELTADGLAAAGSARFILLRLNTAMPWSCRPWQSRRQPVAEPVQRLVPRV